MKDSKYQPISLLSNTHALIHLQEIIRKQLDDSNYDCSIFLNFQQTFDTVDHFVLLEKHNTMVFLTNGLHPILLSPKRIVSINGFNSNLADIKCLMSEGSIIRPLLFLIYINDFLCAMNYFNELTNFSSLNKNLNRLCKNEGHCPSFWPHNIEIVL